MRAINNSPNSAIGGLRPAEIETPEDGPKIDAAIGIPEDTSFATQLKNQQKYELNKNDLQAGDHVYAEFGPSTMAKGFDSPVSNEKRKV